MAEEDHGDPNQCKLLVGWMALAAQGSLVVLVICALLYKRHQENPRRPLFVWGLDVAKQGFSALACHFANLSISLLVSMDNAEASQCSLYFAVFNVDQVLGTTTTILIHKMLVGIARRTRRDRSGEHDIEGGTTGKQWGVLEAISLCGFYGDPPSLRRWGVQVSEWVAAVLMARCMSGTFDLLMKDILLVVVAQAVDRRFDGHPQALLFFVMVFYPLMVNITVAIMVDGVLKRKKRRHRTRSTRVGDETPLIIATSSPEVELRQCELAVCSDQAIYESGNTREQEDVEEAGVASPSIVSAME
ncbi:unnamed protein product [Ostreobium quekettii]|uniref:Uncharacterized protein n=1 Tax=Ostreobium quekettii TaxID=121088 RepID=A0A8S1J7V8_9CHLO|nr:unnamed protein product [Ostreobium quekettii]|eukprot:evm.model.scf_1182.4 EVM.evm.TU.scf_1182.4   scf_1182:24964-26626(+)